MICFGGGPEIWQFSFLTGTLLNPNATVSRSHRIIFRIIALLTIATFAFGILQLIGARR